MKLYIHFLKIADLDIYYSHTCCFIVDIAYQKYFNIQRIKKVASYKTETVGDF